MPRSIRYHDPHGELEGNTMQEDPKTGFTTWTPQQWALFFTALAAFIAAVVNIVTGNPVGLPFAG